MNGTMTLLRGYSEAIRDERWVTACDLARALLHTAEASEDWIAARKWRRREEEIQGRIRAELQKLAGRD